LCGIEKGAKSIRDVVDGEIKSTSSPKGFEITDGKLPLWKHSEIFGKTRRHWGENRVIKFRLLIAR